MESKSFDDIIKSKLDQFRIEAGSDAFEHFEQSKANSEFDQIINNKVESHQLEVFPKDWEVLNRRLENEGVANEFDALIGSKLSSLTSNDRPDWEQFEQILDKDEVFDSEISEKVNNHTVPASDNQWPKLSAHLEEVERRRNRIVITKFIEAAIFILFVLTIMQLYPINNIGKDRTPYRTVAVQEDLRLNNANHISEAGSVDIENISTDLAVSSVLSDSSPQGLIENESNTITNETTLSDNTIIAIANEVGSIHSASNNVVEKEAVVFASNLPINVNGLEIERNPPSVIYTEKQIDHFIDAAAPMYKSNLPNSAMLASLNLGALEYSREKFTIPSLNPVSNLGNGQYWINTYGAPDVNFISTPYDLHYGTEAYQHGSYGYTIGATLSYEKDNWEVESGLAYSSLNYLPFQITEQTGKGATGITETTLKEIIMDFVEIPFNFKYKVFSKKNWSVYANSGLSVGALASANYDIDEKTYAVYAASVDRTNTGGGGEILKRKQFDPGLLNGGSLTNNIFATLNTGIGVTTKISDGISFYAQPTYHHNLAVGGLGPNNDVHSRLSVQIGTKVRL